MVRFVDVPHLAAWIRDTGLDPILRGLVERLERDFSRWPDFELTPRVASHSARGVIELMPTSDAETYGFKYVNGHPDNPARGFQTVTAFGMLADVDNGYPTFVSEMTLLTALRTAATSVMAARALARPDAQTMAMIGAGSQAEFQALAFHGVLGIRRVQVWDTDPAAMDKLARNLAHRGLEVVLATGVAEAVRGADIITTCTADKANAVVLPDELVVAGVHLNAIGGDCPGKTELDAATLRRADVFVEFTAQTRIEGEIQQVEPDFAVTELWQVLTGAATGRRDEAAITVFDSVGFAVEDFSALTFLRDAVAGTAYAQELDLVAEPLDPKDLFSLVQVPAALPVGV